MTSLGKPPLPEWAVRGRARWQRVGRGRPAFAVPPIRGQESVWDYPRPPRVERDARPVRVSADGTEVAASRRALRVLETASPPTFYLPRADVDIGLLRRAAKTSQCEWKGHAHYWDVLGPEGSRHAAAWSYPQPFPEYEILRDHFAFYPSHLACFLDGQRVVPQPGGFYAGWVTAELVGPFKGEPGSEDW